MYRFDPCIPHMAKMKGKFREEVQNSGFNIDKTEKRELQRDVDEAMAEREGFPSLNTSAPAVSRPSRNVVVIDGEYPNGEEALC